MRVLPFIAMCVLFACSEKQRKQEAQEYFKAEIGYRMNSIKDLGLPDSVTTNVLAVDKEIDRLLLISKDVENIQASIDLSKKFFDELAIQYQLKRSDFTDINKQMTLEEIANALKENELDFFNQFIFKHKGAEGSMFTAQ